MASENNCHPEAAAAAARMLMLAAISSRGGGRRRTPRVLAGKGGGHAPKRPAPLPFRQVGRGSFGVLRRDASSEQAPTFEARLRQPQDDRLFSPLTHPRRNQNVQVTRPNID